MSEIADRYNFSESKIKNMLCYRYHWMKYGVAAAVLLCVITGSVFVIKNRRELQSVLLQLLNAKQENMYVLSLEEAQKDEICGEYVPQRLPKDMY